MLQQWILTEANAANTEAATKPMLKTTFTREAWLLSPLWFGRISRDC